MLGEFNARVGADYNSWSRSIGHFGIGKLYENGQRLLELCSYHDLCITNTFFSTKLNHRVSWRHPRSHHWHQLDLVITEDPCWTVSSSLVVITVLTVTPTPPWSAAKYASTKTNSPLKAENTSHEIRIKAARNLSLIYTSVFLTPLRTPSRTAQQTVLRSDGPSPVTPSTNAPWIPSAKRRKRTQTGLKQELPHLNKQSQLSGRHC